MTPSSAPGMGIAEIAEYCDVLKPNVRKMLDRYGVRVWFETGGRPVYKRSDVERMQAERLKDSAARAADEKRRESALNKR